LSSFKVIIAGSRNFDNYNQLKTYCNHILKNKENIEIVCGLAKGADILGKKYAEENNYSVAEFPANWDKFGKSAGYIRNAEMVKYADAAIIFWNGKSSGSKHMIDLAKKEGIFVRTFIKRSIKPIDL
jgi:hypothetical protein